jgi:hypothetical protein
MLKGAFAMPAIASKLAMWSAFGTALILAALPAPASAADIRGLWNVSVTPVDCNTGDPLAPAFGSLLSFNDGGTESEDTNNPALQPGQRSTAFGVWKQKSENTYEMDTYALILFGTDGPPPIEAGSQQIHQDILLSRKSWTSNATVQFFDAGGTLYRSGCAKAAAMRLK